jgi:DNA ligase (NAD+)
VIAQLRAAGVRWARRATAGGVTLAGLGFVLTGTLPTMSRDEASELIRAHGGTVSSSVSRKTSYVLAGEDAGSKLERARELGVPVIGEPELMRLIEGGSL